LAPAICVLAGSGFGGTRCDRGGRRLKFDFGEGRRRRFLGCHHDFRASASDADGVYFIAL
jgi:hypothetical protein